MPPARRPCWRIGAHDSRVHTGAGRITSTRTGYDIDDTCVCVLDRDQTRHPGQPTTTISASPVLWFTGLNMGVGSCIPYVQTGGVGGGRGESCDPMTASRRGRSQAPRLGSERRHTHMQI